MKRTGFLTFILVSLLSVTAGCMKDAQQPTTTTDEAKSAPSIPAEPVQKPFKYTITTNLLEPFNGQPVAVMPGFPTEGDVHVRVHVNSLDGKYPVKYDLDCEGDGDYEFTGLTESHDCIYPLNSGVHQIWLRGEIPSLELCHMEGGEEKWFQGYHEQELFTKSVDDWGDISWKSMSAFAKNCRLLNRLPHDAPNLSDVTDMSRMFTRASAFNQPIDDWDVTHVNNMSEMFRSASSFNQPLEKWNVSNVENMSGMFWDAYTFNQPLEKWNVSHVTDMSHMFEDTAELKKQIESYIEKTHDDNIDKNSIPKITPFNQPLNQWNVSNVKNMSGMFKDSTFNQPLDHWNVSNVKNMSNMFESSEFNQPLDMWDVSHVTDMSQMFAENKVFNQPLDKWNVSSVRYMDQMFYDCSVFQYYPKSWVVPDGDAKDMFKHSKIEKIALKNPLKTVVKLSDNDITEMVEYIDIANWCRPKMGKQISAKEWANGSNAFGLKLLKTIKGNTVFSPYSIERAMGMPLESACLETADEMLRVLELPNTKRLSMSGLEVEHAFRTVNRDTILEIEHVIWPDKTLSLPNDFLARISAGYRSKITQLDYRQNPQQAVATINNAVSEATHHRINDLVPETAVTANTKIIATNAVYYKSKWKSIFDSKDTRKETFYNDSDYTQTMMMHQEFSHGQVCIAADYAFFDMAFNSARGYGDKGAYFMRVILPTIDDKHPMSKRMEWLTATENQLSFDFKSNCKMTKYDYVDVSLPKFSMHPEAFSIKEILSQMGMKKAFSDGAEFYAMSEDSSKPDTPAPYLLKLQDVFHRAYIDVDETGAEAAAASSISGMSYSIQPTKPTRYKFKVDHPFIFMIIEKSTGAALFMGRVVSL